MSLRRRTLPVLAGLFALAAVLKAADGIGTALAQMPAARPATAATAPVLAAAPAPPRQAVTPDLLIDLHRREQALAERMEALDARSQALAEAESRIRDQLAALQTAERDLAATMALADRAAETDLQRLTAVFEAMRPEQAAQVVAEMAPEFAAGLIARLRPETAAPILAGVEPRLAYGLSAILAGRNADVPRR